MNHAPGSSAPVGRVDAPRDLPAWSAAIINFNGGDLVCDTIASIKAMEHPPSEILLVDDGSTDSSLSEVSRHHPEVRILTMPHHTGRPAVVRNEALRNARHRYVLLCDHDLRLAPDVMRQLMGTMLSRPNVAVCSGVVVFADNPGRIELRAHPLHFLCWSTAVQVRDLAEAKVRGARPGVGCGIQLVDREAAELAGWFNENLALGWMDDGDLHHRLNLYGYESLSVPEAVVTHRRVRKVSRTYGQIHNRWYLLLSHYQLRTLVVISPTLITFELLIIAYMIRSGELANYVRAIRDVIAKLPQVRTQRRKVQRRRQVSDKQVLSALDLDLPRHLRDKKGLVLLMNCLSTGFRCYWSIGLLVLKKGGFRRPG